MRQFGSKRVSRNAQLVRQPRWRRGRSDDGRPALGDAEEESDSHRIELGKQSGRDLACWRDASLGSPSARQCASVTDCVLGSARTVRRTDY